MTCRYWRIDLLSGEWFILPINDCWRAKKMIGEDKIKSCFAWRDWKPSDISKLNLDFDSNTYYGWFKQNEKK